MSEQDSFRKGGIVVQRLGGYRSAAGYRASPSVGHQRIRARIALTSAVALLIGVAFSGNAIAAKGGPGGGGDGGGGGAAPLAVAVSPPHPRPGGGAEPGIKNASDGKSAAYVTAPAAIGSNFWYVDEIKNADGTTSFKPTLRQFDLDTGGGDAEISLGNKIDPSTGCLPIAFSGLHNIDLLTNFTTSTSTDCGHTWAAPNLFAVQNVGVDRQWQTFDGAKTNFLIYHEITTSEIVVSRSLDAGATYTSLSPEGARGIIDPATMPAAANNNQIGNIVTDYSQATGGTYSNGDPIHALYAIFGAPRDAADNAAGQQAGADTSAYNHVDTIYVGKSTDGGVTWTDAKVFGVDPSTNRELNMLFPVVAVDSAGTVYAAWSDGFKIQYAFSKDHGTTWSKAYQVNTDNRGTTLDPTKADLFPWIAAGSNGKLDLTWYHGTGGDTSGHRDPGTPPNPDTGDPGTQWTVAFAQLLNANVADTTGAPTPKVTALDLDVSGLIHKGDICNNGIGCDVFGGDRTLLDFFQISVDSAGRANIAFASDADSPGSATSSYVRQKGGLSATTGKRLATQTIVPLAIDTGSSCPGPQVIDPFDDAQPSVTTGEGSDNVDTLDIGGVRFTTPDAANIQITLTLKDLSAIPAAGVADNMWTVYWNYNGTTYYVSANSNAPALQFYDYGTYTDDFNSRGSATGAFVEGPNGTITWTLPRAAVDLPASGTATLTKPYADDHGAFWIAGNNTARYVAYVDRAPDVSNGADYTVGGAC
jgi:hypothetical protein